MGENQLGKVVVIGGGTGLSVILRGLKQKSLDLTAIVTVADDGGSSGRLRSELDMLPPGDIRNVLISLANTEPLLEKLLQYRFEKGEGLRGHNLGNLLIAAMQEITGDFVLAIKELSRVLAVNGRVLPATLQKVILSAEYVDGTITYGESNIPKENKRIKRMFIEPSDVKPLEEAITAIYEADAILLGPGSLYTSVIPNLLVKEIKDAIIQAKGKKIYICNLMTQPGETDNYSALEHIRAIEEHVGEKFLEYILVHDENIPNTVIKQYSLKGAVPVKINKDILIEKGYGVIEDKFINIDTYLRHDAAKLAESIITILNENK